MHLTFPDNIEQESSNNHYLVYLFDKSLFELGDRISCSYSELIDNFCINNQSEIFLRLGTRWNDSLDYNVHEFLDSIFPCFRDPETTFSPDNQAALLQSREIGINDLQVQFFEKASFYRNPDQPSRHIKNLGVQGDPQIIINLCIKLNELILMECSEPSYSILIQSENKVAAISSVKNEDHLFLFHDINKVEAEARLDKYFLPQFLREIEVYGLTEDECPDLETYKLRWKKDLEDRNYSEEEIMRILRYETTYRYVQFFQAHLSSRHGEDFRFL